MFLTLITFFFLSIAAAAYVIFFRVVIASADQDPFNPAVASIVRNHPPVRLRVGTLPGYLSGSTEKLYIGEER